MEDPWKKKKSSAKPKLYFSLDVWNGNDGGKGESTTLMFYKDRYLHTFCQRVFHLSFTRTSRGK